MSAVFSEPSSAQIVAAISARLNKPWPTMYDLPSEEPNEPGFPDQFHSFQGVLLTQTFQPPTYPADQLFVARNLYLYYDLTHPHWHVSPDWFAVVGVSRVYQPTADFRYSYVIWDEPVLPFMVVEILAKDSRHEELGANPTGQPPTKWQVYGPILHIPYYVVFDQYANEMRLFKWMQLGYQELSLLNNQFWFEEIQLGLGLWKGKYDGLEHQWLRWYTEDGQWIPTLAERVEIERAARVFQQIALERERAAQAEQRVLQLAAKLRALGIDPDQL